MVNFELDGEATPATTPSKLGLKRLSSFHAAGSTPRHGHRSSAHSAAPSQSEGSGGIHRSNSAGGSVRRKLTPKPIEPTVSPSPQQELPHHSMELLLDSLNQMGSLSELKESLRRGLLPRLKSVIFSVMQKAKNTEFGKHETATFSPHQPSSTNLSLSIPPAVAEVSERLLTNLCKRIQVILYNLMGVLKLIALKDKNNQSSDVRAPGAVQGVVKNDVTGVAHEEVFSTD